MGKTKKVSQFDSLDKRSRIRLHQRRLTALHRQINQASGDMKALDKQREQISAWRDELVVQRNGVTAAISALENVTQPKQVEALAGVGAAQT